MTWTVDPRVAHPCGGASGCVIPAGEPIAVAWQSPTHPWRRLLRCAQHAGAPVNTEEVENERWRLEREAAQATEPRQVAPPVPRAPRPVSRWSAVSDLVATVDPRLPRGDRE